MSILSATTVPDDASLLEAHISAYLSMVLDIAHDLGMDPVVVRQRNYYAAPGDGGAAPRPAASPRDICGQKIRRL